MDGGLRDSGIGLIGGIAWGTHISQIYTSKDDFRLPACFIKAGLHGNELCVWIYSRNASRAQIMELLRLQEPDADGYEARGQLIVMPHTDWYMGKDGEFNDVRVSAQWVGLVRKALESGYAGLRAVADTSWLDKCHSRDFSRYESNINPMISELPFVVICQYDAGKIGAAEFADIVKNHSISILEAGGDLKVIRNVELLVKSSQLEASRESYKRLLDLLPDAVFIHDGSKILYCNEAAAGIAGYGCPRELTGGPMADIVAAEAREGFLEQSGRLLAGEPAVRRFESLFVSRSGEFRDVELTAVPYSFQGFPAVLSVIRDVSYRNKITELENGIRETLESDRIKTDFFSNISHELRTPVSIILTALQMLQMQYGEAMPDSRLKYHNIIQQNCYRLLRLVNNIIDTNRLDSEFYDIRMQNCNIVAIVETIAASVMDYADEKGIRLAFESGMAEKTIACDPNAIERIVLNLISNALKFTSTGGHVCVRLADLGSTVALCVTDDGAGIPPERQKVIFDRFRQAGHLHARENEGSGIGLALVKSLVEKHNGTIAVQSEYGSGSTFTVELPCGVLPEPEEPAGRVVDMYREGIAERINIEFSDIYSVSVR
jgi:PAS domain S-box-containing protein